MNDPHTASHPAPEDRRDLEVLQGLCLGYNSVYLADFGRRTLSAYSLVSGVSLDIMGTVGTTRSYDAAFHEFCDKYLVPENRANFATETSLENVRRRLQNENWFSFIFRRSDGKGVIDYVQMQAARISDPNCAVIGFRTVTPDILGLLKLLEGHRTAFGQKAEGDGEGGDKLLERWTHNRFKGKHLLLAEDNELTREVTALVLEAAGFSVDRAPDGQEEVRAFERSPEGYYDLVLTDVQMPKMNGYAAAETIRRMKRTDSPTVPIVAFSTAVTEESMQAAYASGMSARTAKPLDIVDFLSTVSSFPTLQ